MSVINSDWPELSKYILSQAFISHNSGRQEFIKLILLLFCFAQRLSFTCETQKLYVSVNSKPDHPPPRAKSQGNFFDGRIPHSPGKKRVQNPPPLEPIKTSYNPTPGAFSSIIHYKNMKKWYRSHVKLQDFIIFRWLKNKLSLQLRSHLHQANLLW